LIEKIEGKKVESPQEIILEPELIVRKTCGFHLRGYQIKPQNRYKMDYVNSEARDQE
jgi:hypothetical protein